jgi:hypothetical protein
MSDLQAKLGGGLNKLQDGIQQSKNKLQTAQEISQYKKAIQEKRLTRSNLILKLGEELYEKMRKGLIEESMFNQPAEEILRIDMEIYSAQNRLSELNDKNLSQGSTCECGAAVGEADKFCGGCGKSVIAAVKQTEPTKECQVCETPNPVSSKFCGCCGSIA